MIQLSVLQTFADLFSNFKNIEIGQIAMLAIGAVLIYLAIKRKWSRRFCFRSASAQFLLTFQ